MKKWGTIALLLLIGAGVFFFCKQKQSATKARQVAVNASTHVSSLDSQIHFSLDTFFTNRNLQNGFSGSVLVSKNGKLLYQNCFGYCDYTAKNLMTDTSAFQLASVSKTFTATAVLWCVEHNMFSLDDTLQKFFPLLPYKNIRVKDLLSHRSGLPNYIYFCSGKCKANEYLSNEQVLEIMQREKPAAYALPDKKFEYCNTNYLLLASIVERASGKKFQQFMHEIFFAPLNMRCTFVFEVSDSADRKIATSYNSKWQIQHNDCFDGVVGDKGVYSTVSDMFRWDMAFYEGKLLSQQMMKEAYTPRSFEKPGKRNYGYGWRLLQQPDSSYLVYHNGWWHGNNTVFYRNLRDTTAVVILSNKYNRSVYRVQPVFDILYGLNNGSADFEEE